MKKFVIVTADTNDADYITEKTEITDDQIENIIKPVIAQLEVRRKKLNEDRHKNWNEWRHNWETSQYGRIGNPKEMYVNTGLLTQEQVDAFQDYVPHGEYGVHTIEKIEIVYGGERLF
jgi:hypothetical protein